MKWIKRLLYFFGVLYILMCIVLYSIQHRVVFNPDVVSESKRYKAGEEVEIPLNGGIDMNCLWVRNLGSSKGVILYLHGNRGNIGRALHQTRLFNDKNYDIFIPDYRGYGKTEGFPKSAKQLEQDVEKAYLFLKEHYSENQIVLIGYSLGSGMASYIAATHQPKSLIILAPYISIAQIKNKYFWFLPDFLLRYNLRNDKYLKDIECPITLIHGTNDNVIPYESSPYLKDLQPDNIELVTLNGEGHRGVIFDERTARVFDRLLQ